MTTTIQNIAVAEDIRFLEEFIELKKTRRLSKITNDLWRQYFNVKSTVPSDKIRIEDELQSIAARKALLQEKKKDIEAAEEREKNRYVVVE